MKNDICPKCGYVYSDEKVKFCGKCGTKMNYSNENDNVNSCHESNNMISEKSYSNIDNNNDNYFSNNITHINEQNTNNRNKTIIILLGVVLVIITIGICIFAKKYNDFNVYEDGKRYLVGQAIPIYDTTIIVTDDNVYNIENIIEIEHMNYSGWRYKTYNLDVQLQSELIQKCSPYLSPTPYMQTNINVVFFFDKNEWNLVQIEKGDKYEECWGNDVVNPKNYRIYPATYSSDSMFFPRHWSYSVLSTACEENMPGLLDYFLSSIIRQYECLEFSQDGNYIQCAVSAEFWNSSDGSIEKWDLIFSVWLNESGEVECCFDYYDGGLIPMIEIYDEY